MTELSTHVFELDLTSVCVSTGIVQLPMKMQPFFEDGLIDATLDGESVRLEFQGPRRLGGFKSHFEKRGLNANDKIRFELTSEGQDSHAVQVACVKRERGKQQLEARSTPGQALSADDSEDGGGEEPKNDGQRGSWGSSSSSIRAVRKVTIIGSDTLMPASNSSLLGGAGTEGARAAELPRQRDHGHLAKWQALDGLSHEAESEERPAEVEFADTTVRAIRRRAKAPEPLPYADEETVPPTAAAPAADAHVTMSEPEVSQASGATSAPVRLSDLLAPPEQRAASGPRGRPVQGGRPRLFGGRGSRSEQFSVRDAGRPVEPPRPARPHNDVEELITERELVPVLRGARQPKAESAAANLDVSQAGPRYPANTQLSRVSTAEVEYGQALGRMELDGPAAASPLFRPPAEESLQAERGTSQPAASPDPQPPAGFRNSVLPVIDDADFGGGYVGYDDARDDSGAHQLSVESAAAGPEMAEAERPKEAAPGSAPDLDADLKVVSEFVNRPDVPAIVRSDAVAERLGLTAERCERALERLSEDRDRISLIRKGAYMIRRDATKR